jgi:hypothetical protein
MNIERIKNELAQAWTVAVKDVRVYYLRPGMIMFGFLMPFFHVLLILGAAGIGSSGRRGASAGPGGLLHSRGGGAVHHPDRAAHRHV